MSAVWPRWPRRSTWARFLRLGHGEEQGGGRTRESILADAVESVLAASYLDGGFQAAKGIIQRLILTELPQGRPGNFDCKTMLQELVQRQKDQVIQYHLTGETGPDHDKHFTVEVSLNGQVVGAGDGRSKKRAEQAAAEAALRRLFPPGVRRGPSLRRRAMFEGFTPETVDFLWGIRLNNERGLVPGA